MPVIDNLERVLTEWAKSLVNNYLNSDHSTNRLKHAFNNWGNKDFPTVKDFINFIAPYIKPRESLEEYQQKAKNWEKMKQKGKTELKALKEIIRVRP